MLGEIFDRALRQVFYYGVLVGAALVGLVLLGYWLLSHLRWAA